MKYTLTIPSVEENKFRNIVSRLNDGDYTIIQHATPVDETQLRTCDRVAIIDMDPESALTFRLGMKHVKIRRERNEEELAEEKRINDMNTVKINIKVDEK